MLSMLYAARRYYRNWGTTKDECRSVLPGDELIGRPAVQSTEGIWIDAPVDVVWAWLAQIGQDRAGFYSYGTLEGLLGLGSHSDVRIEPEWQHLAAGDVIRLAPEGWLGLRRGLALQVAQVIDREALVLRGQPPDFPWAAVWSIHIAPRWQNRCRVLVRTRARLRYPGEVFMIELAGPLIALLIRGLLTGLRRRVQVSSSANCGCPS